MATFLNVGVGETRAGPGIRLCVSDDGERAWFHGKWLDLGQDHAVIWIDGAARFIRADGKVLLPGEFPAWVIKSSKRGGPLAMMFSATQFAGGRVEIRKLNSRHVFNF